MSPHIDGVTVNPIDGEDDDDGGGELVDDPEQAAPARAANRPVAAIKSRV
jgi:hypothetical protein